MTDRSADWAARRLAWEAGRLGSALERAPERRPRFSTISDMPIERLYGPWSLPDSDPLRDIGLPGEPPFTRGVHPTARCRAMGPRRATTTGRTGARWACR